MNNEGSVNLHWVKAHIGNMGNEIADKASNQAHKNDRTELYPLDELEQNSIPKQKFTHTWIELWKANALITNKGKTIRENVFDSIATRYMLNRREKNVIQRLRTVHAGVLQHLHRFNIYLKLLNIISFSVQHII